MERYQGTCACGYASYHESMPVQESELTASACPHLNTSVCTSHAQRTRTSAHAQRDAANVHAPINVTMSNKASMEGITRCLSRHCWARGLSLTRESVHRHRPHQTPHGAVRSSARRWSRCRRIQPSGDMLVAVLGGSPAEAHPKVVLPDDLQRAPVTCPVPRRCLSGAVRVGAH